MPLKSSWTQLYNGSLPDNIAWHPLIRFNICTQLGELRSHLFFVELELLVVHWHRNYSYLKYFVVKQYNSIVWIFWFICKCLKFWQRYVHFNGFTLIKCSKYQDIHLWSILISSASQQSVFTHYNTVNKVHFVLTKIIYCTLFCDLAMAKTRFDSWFWETCLIIISWIGML